MINFAPTTKANFHHPQKNEDAILVDDEKMLFAVFDGMGGRSAGQASQGSTKSGMRATATVIKIS